jgi:hypothetical protein
MLWLMAAMVCLPGTPVRGGDIVLNFSDVASGTFTVFNPYTSQGFQLTSTSGGFVFNSPDTGNGSFQTVGNNPFYTGANGLAAFVPATITLTQTNGDPFSLLSIDLARIFSSDPAPSVPCAGTLAGGGTVHQMLTVTTSSPPLTFQTFDLTGFTNVISVSWEQDVVASEGVHQFGNIHLFIGAVPEPASRALLALGIAPALASAHHSRLALSRRKRIGELANRIRALLRSSPWLEEREPRCARRSDDNELAWSQFASDDQTMRAGKETGTREGNRDADQRVWISWSHGRRHSE